LANSDNSDSNVTPGDFDVDLDSGPGNVGPVFSAGNGFASRFTVNSNDKPGVAKITVRYLQPTDSTVGDLEASTEVYVEEDIDMEEAGTPPEQKKILWMKEQTN